MQPQPLYQAFLPAGSGPTSAYVWKYSPISGGLRPRHFHNEPELNLVVSGWAKFGIGKRVVTVSAGELVGFQAGQDHELLATSQDAFLFAIGMTPALASTALNSQPGRMAVPLHLRLKPKEFQSITRRAELVVDQVGVEQACSELWEQAHWLDRHGTTDLKEGLHVLTRRALRLIAESPELSLEALARSAKANASEVSRYFHRDLGMTFVRYRTRLRLLRFIQLAEQRCSSWATAAVTAGFGSYSQCHRSFQAELSCSPRAFFRAGLLEEMQQSYNG